MSPDIRALLLFILFFVCLYYMYGSMVSSIVAWSKKASVTRKGKFVKPKLTAGEVVQCYLPMWQVAFMHRSLYHSYGIWAPWSIVTFVCIATRLLNMLVPINGNVMFITIFVMWLGILMHILLYAIPTAAVAKMYGYSWGIIILSFLFPHFCAYLGLKGGISTKMIMLKKEETFKEDADTHIQQRVDKRQSVNSVPTRRGAR